MFGVSRGCVEVLKRVTFNRRVLCGHDIRLEAFKKGHHLATFIRANAHITGNTDHDLDKPGPIAEGRN